MTDDRTALAARVAELADAAGLRIAAAESLTGGMIASALAEAKGASDWFRGCLVAYATEVKHDLLDVPPGPVVSRPAAEAMASGALRLLGADLAVAVTGSGGPEPQDDQPPGTVFIGLATPDGVRVTGRRYPDQEPVTVCESAAADALRILVEHLEERAAGERSG